MNRVLGYQRLTKLVRALAADDPDRIARFPVGTPPGAGVFPVVGGEQLELRAVWLAVREHQRVARILLGHHMYAGAAIAHGSASAELEARAMFVLQSGADPRGRVELQLYGEDCTFTIDATFWDDSPTKSTGIHG